MRRRVHSSSWLSFFMVCLVATASSQSVPPVSFRVAPSYAVGSGTLRLISMAAGDFNGDGKPDLAVVTCDFTNGSSSLSGRVGNVHATLQPAAGYAPGSGPGGVVGGDRQGGHRP